MKATRIYLVAVSFGIVALCLSNLVSLTGYFQSVESGGGGGPSEKRALAQIQQLVHQLKSTDDPESAKIQIRLMEGSGLFASGSENLELFRKAYAPVISAYASKPKEAEDRFRLVKKRELMENLVNSYRKEISGGRIPVRAAYLNILFDTQNSLLNESPESEEVFIKRNRDRFNQLKSLVSGDNTLAIRVAGLESIFSSFENGFERSRKWKAELKDVLAEAEKSAPRLAKSFVGSSGDRAEGARRLFLYSSVTAIVCALLAFAVLLIAHKLLKVRFEAKLETFSRLFQEFGRERSDPNMIRELNELLEDPNWEPLARGFREAEANFLEEFQSLLAVPRSLTTAFVVVGRDRNLKRWNREAENCFGLSAGNSYTLDDILKEEVLRKKHTGDKTLQELVQESFSANDTVSYEVMLKQGEEFRVCELLAFPIHMGALAGGRLILFREIRSESERVEKAVTSRLMAVRETARKITQGAIEEERGAGAEYPEVRAVVEDLWALKRAFDEKELLWKSETGALLDQVSRQKEILEKLQAETREIMDAHGRILELVEGIHGGDEHWHDEVCTLERDVERWKQLKQGLEKGIDRKQNALEIARSFEEEVRSAAGELTGFLDSFEQNLKELRNFSEEAKIHAVNMGFVKDPSYREFAARSRAYAHDVSRFLETVDRLSGRIKSFLAGHPATSLAPLLDSGDIDPSLLLSLKEEEERFNTYLQRWKESGQGLVAVGEEAVKLLKETEKRGATVAQLGETSLLINDQAQGNLQRWN